MIQVINHYFKNQILENDKLNNYKFIIFDTEDETIAKNIFAGRFLNTTKKVLIIRPTNDPLVSYFNNLGYFIRYIQKPDGSENFDNVVIEVPNIDINQFEFTKIKNIEYKNNLLFVSKYQILWDTFFLESYTNIIDTIYNKNIGFN